MNTCIALLILLIGIPTIKSVFTATLAKIDLADLKLDRYTATLRGKTLLCSFRRDTSDKSKTVVRIRKSYPADTLNGLPNDYQDHQEIYDFLRTNPRAIPENLLLRDPALTPGQVGWSKGTFDLKFGEEKLSEYAADEFQEIKVPNYWK